MASANNKNNKKQKIIVVSIAVIASVLVVLFTLGNNQEAANEDPNKIALYEGGEASDINTSVPSISNRVKDVDSTLMGSYNSYENSVAEEKRLQEEGVYGMGGNSFLFQNAADVQKKKSKEDEEERRKLEEELGIKSSKSMKASMQSLNEIGDTDVALTSKSGKKNKSGGSNYNVYGDYSMWNNASKTNTSKKSKSSDDTSDWDNDSQDDEFDPKEKEREERRQRAIELKELANTSTGITNSVGEKSKANNSNSSLDNLSATERRRALLHSGGKYKESESIEAKIVSTGTVRAGQTVRLITSQVAYLKGKTIPSGTIIAGVVSFSENRMDIRLSTIRLKNEIINVNLTVYSMDGLQGFAVDGFNDSEEIENEGISEGIKAAGRIGRVVGSVISPKRTRKAQSLTLGRDVRCLLVNDDLRKR